MEERGSRAEALLIQDDRISRVGEERSVLRAANARGARLWDADGRKVIPGLIDSHTHLVHQGLLRHRVDLREARSKRSALARVERAVRAHRGRGPLIAERWDESSWARREWPTREELDAITRRFPLVLRRVDGHVAVPNSAALDALEGRLPGVDRERGLLIEEASLHLNRVWPTPLRTSLEAARTAQATALRLGVTSVHDFVVPSYLAAFRRLDHLGQLRLRVVATPYAESPQHPRPFDSSPFADTPRLRRGGVKAFADGSLGGHTAALRQPYSDARETPGTLNWTPAQLAALLQASAREGRTPSLHAIGDAAIDQVLAAYRRLPRAKARFLRPRVEHFELHHPEHLEQARDQGLVLSMQPNFVGEWSLPGGMYHARLGPRRYRRNNEFREILRAGCRLAFGSDCMPFDPWFGLESVVHAPHLRQRLPIEDALRAYTLGSAFGLGLEADAGSLAPGKRADLVVLRGDWSRRGGMGATRVDRVMVDGHWAPVA